MAAGVPFASYRRRETTVSAAINMAFSALFYMLVFGMVERVPMRGLGNYAFDFLPQSAAIGLMASLVPSLLLRSALIKKRIANVEGAVVLTQVAQVVLRAVLAAVTAGAFLLAVFWLAMPDTVGRAAALPLKLAYGAALGSTITWFALPAIMKRLANYDG